MTSNTAATFCLVFSSAIANAQPVHNRPLEKLSPEQRAVNEKYVDELVRVSGQDALQVALGLLAQPETVYLARPLLLMLGRQTIPPLREIVADRSFAPPWRLEVLKVLDALGDTVAIDFAALAIFPRPRYGPNTSELPFQEYYLSWRLRGLSEPEKVDALLALMRDYDHTLLAKGALIDTGVTSVPGLMVLALDGQEEYGVRVHSVNALHQIGDKRATPALVQILLDESADDRLRDTAAGALGALCDPQGLSPLQSVAATWTPDPGTDVATYDVRREAREAAEKIRSGCRAAR